ncbi:MAG: hypothetical protein R2753_14285 [Chitinophagales bacterium]
MAKEGRIESKEINNHLEVSIKVLKNPYVYIPLIITGFFWIIGLYWLTEKVLTTYRTLIEMSIAGMLFFWLILGGLIFSTLYWVFFGKERVIITHQFVQTEKPIHLYKRRRAYLLQDVSNFRIDNELYKARRNGEWVDENRIVIKFSTPQKEVAFGRGLKPKEAEFILIELAKSDFLEPHHFMPISKT